MQLMAIYIPERKELRISSDQGAIVKLILPSMSTEQIDAQLRGEGYRLSLCGGNENSPRSYTKETR